MREKGWKEEREGQGKPRKIKLSILCLLQTVASFQASTQLLSLAVRKAFLSLASLAHMELVNQLMLPLQCCIALTDLASYPGLSK